VYSLGNGIRNIGVGSHFDATLRASLIFRRPQKGRLHALAATSLGDKPAFEVAHGQFFVTTVRSRAEISFEKANERPVARFRDENYQGIDALRSFA